MHAIRSFAAVRTAAVTFQQAYARGLATGKFFWICIFFLKEILSFAHEWKFTHNISSLAGTVKWFNNSKGFGFITPDEAADQEGK